MQIVQTNLNQLGANLRALDFSIPEDLSVT